MHKEIALTNDADCVPQTLDRLPLSTCGIDRCLMKAGKRRPSIDLAALQALDQHRRSLLRQIDPSA
ncbi:hypothetical protein GCM10010520_63620 [Rhizobium viscosum]